MPPRNSTGRAAPQRILTYRAAGYWRRAAAFFFWLCASAVLPAAAITNALGGFVLVALILSFAVQGRMSPIPALVAASQRRTAKALRAAPRARVRIVAPAISPLYGLLGGLVGWIVPTVVGGVAIEHQSFPLALVAAALLGVAAWAMHRLVFAHRREALTVGLDGVAVDGHGFAAWRDVRGAGFAQVVMPAGDTQPALVLDVERGDSSEQWSIPMDEAGAKLFARELEQRREAKPPEVPAGLSEELVTAGTVPWRDAAVPVGDLVRTLRDPGAAREERVRVAELLRVHAPEEVDRFAEETADAELEAEIGRAAAADTDT